MSPRPDVSQERRKQILDAALVVFTRQGYDKARMDDIAQEAGLSKGSLYWYFKGKKELFLALFDATMDEMLEAMGEIDPASGSASDLIHCITNPMREVMGGQELTSILASFFIQHRHDEGVQQAIQDVFQNYLDLLADVIRAGIASGEFRDDLDPEHVAGGMAAAFDGLEMQILVLPEMDWRARLDQTVEIFLSGIRRDPAGA